MSSWIYTYTSNRVVDISSRLSLHPLTQAHTASRFNQLLSLLLLFCTCEPNDWFFIAQAGFFGASQTGPLRLTKIYCKRASVT
jgi:hypothetical protein